MFIRHGDQQFPEQLAASVHEVLTWTLSLSGWASWSLNPALPLLLLPLPEPSNQGSMTPAST